MPKWGLPPELSALSPWGLDPSLLEPDKTNTDPIHDDIYLNRLERRVCDSPAFQRLRRIRQLGTAHLVYPGATHTRFQHSLGTLRVAQDLFDHVTDNPSNRDPETNLLGEWRADGDVIYRRQLAEAQVLAR